MPKIWNSTLETWNPEEQSNRENLGPVTMDPGCCAVEPSNLGTPVCFECRLGICTCYAQQGHRQLPVASRTFLHQQQLLLRLWWCVLLTASVARHSVYMAQGTFYVQQGHRQLRVPSRAFRCACRFCLETLIPVKCCYPLLVGIAASTSVTSRPAV